MARKFKANLILNNDAHAPADFVSSKMATKIASGAGLNDNEISVMFENSQKMVQKVSV
jgi:histidinol phosphatase-like PHP family hydrolase